MRAERRSCHLDEGPCEHKVVGEKNADEQEDEGDAGATGVPHTTCEMQSTHGEAGAMRDGCSIERNAE